MIDALIDALARPSRVPLLDGDAVPLLDEETPAAVLMAITNRAEPGVILTQRPAHMRRHAGQIAFPGGRIEPDDASPVAAALREAHEEVALPPDAARVIGIADPYRSGSGYRITPVLATIAPDLPLHPADGEVGEIFEVPLAYLLNRANHALREGEWKGKMRAYYAITCGERLIWGVTAGIIVNLARRLI